MERDQIIEDLFLIYKDGRLISHHTRRLKPETDEYSITAMLTAIQDFVRESIPTEGEKQKAIDEISFGEQSIQIVHGKYVYIAAVIAGGTGKVFRDRMEETLENIELEFVSTLEDWDGVIGDLDGAKLMMKTLLRERAPEEEEGELPDEDEEKETDEEE
jgi:OOP family OmpA-OmpF porin